MGVRNGTLVHDKRYRPSQYRSWWCNLTNGISVAWAMLVFHRRSFECSFRRRGLTLEELANMLIEHGAIYAINMDGGGSSTLISGMDYEVINRPTCLDIPKVVCQRPVASVLCVSALSKTTSP
jgi:hypothetical protein